MALSQWGVILVFDDNSDDKLIAKGPNDKSTTDCPNKNANQTFGIDNFQNYESI